LHDEGQRERVLSSGERAPSRGWLAGRPRHSLAGRPFVADLDDRRRCCGLRIPRCACRNLDVLVAALSPG